jgi:transcriptional antiterminator RfaH
MSELRPSPIAPGPPWVVINTHPHCEERAVENLQRQDFETYCPMIRRRRSHARRVDDVLRPLFPSYLFVRAGGPSLRWRPMLSTYGVRTLVRCGEDPGIVDGRFIEALRAREVDGAVVRPEIPYRAGQTVQMAGGPFDGLLATILSVDEQDRLVVLLDFMQRSVRMRVESRSVAPV